jgi:hypothetical protein
LAHARFVTQTEISLFAVKLYLKSDQQDRLFKGGFNDRPTNAIFDSDKRDVNSIASGYKAYKRESGNNHTDRSRFHKLTLSIQLRLNVNFIIHTLIISSSVSSLRLI